MTIRDSRDYFRVLSYSYYTTITGWEVLLIYEFQSPGCKGSSFALLGKGSQSGVLSPGGFPNGCVSFHAGVGRVRDPVLGAPVKGVIIFGVHRG